jgi:hypothetical protein
MARFSLAHAGEPISVEGRQLYLDPARAIKQAFLPSGVHVLHFWVGGWRQSHVQWWLQEILLLLGERRGCSKDVGATIPEALCIAWSLKSGLVKYIL